MRAIQRFWSVALSGMAVAAIGLIGGGCGEQKTRFSTGLSALEQGDPEPVGVNAAELASPEQQDQLKLMESALTSGGVSVDAPRRPAQPKPAKPLAVIDRTTSETPVEVDESDPAGPTEEAPAEDAVADGAQGKQSVERLAAELRERARTSSAPVGELLRLAALELVQSGSVADAGTDAAALTPSEERFLSAWRELFKEARGAIDAGSDFGDLASKVAELAERMRADNAVSIIDARLCKVVEGFGDYSEVARSGEADRSYTFVAGRGEWVIVYTELANFTHTPKSKGGVDGYVVELSQGIELFQVVKGGEVSVWKRPSAGTSDFSRSKRRDYHITDRVRLPDMLAAGSYRLKVSVTDTATGAIGEAVIPLEFKAR